jgi:uncharacterized membrane protein YesL
MAKKNFFEGPIYTITNYIYWFALSNIYFILLNIFLVMILISPVDPSEINAAYYILLYLVLLPVGPSITALLAVMGKLVRDGDVSITKEYFKAYRQNFKQSLFLWFVVLTLIAVMLADIGYFAGKSKLNMLIPLFNGMIIILLIMSLYIFPIVSRFYMKASDVIKLSFYYAVKKFKVTLLNIAGIIAVGLLIKAFPSVSIFFFASVACYMLMYYEKDILKEIEEKVVGNSNEEPQENTDESILTKDIDNDIQ